MYQHYKCINILHVPTLQMAIPYVACHRHYVQSFVQRVSSVSAKWLLMFSRPHLSFSHFPIFVCQDLIRLPGSFCGNKAMSELDRPQIRTGCKPEEAQPYCQLTELSHVLWNTSHHGTLPLTAPVLSLTMKWEDVCALRAFCHCTEIASSTVKGWSSRSSSTSHRYQVLPTLT